MSRLAAGLRSLPLALVGSASARLHDLTAADAAVRAPLTLNRRIGVVQAAGGSGASTVAANLASIVAHRRSGLVLAVNASAGTHNVLWHAGVPTSDAGRPVGRTLPTAPRSAEQATAQLPVSPTGLLGLDLRHPAHPTTPAPSRTWFDHINPVSRFFDLVVTDWGVRGWQVDLSQVALASHVMCIVTRSERHAVEEAAAIVPALQGQGDGLRIVFVIVNVSGTRGSAPTMNLTRTLGVPVIRIPHDPAAGAATPVASVHTTAQTRISHAVLAGTIMAEAQRSLLAPGTPSTHQTLEAIR
ncbi:hypothetical protein GY21_07650 [Cryobacterium roopkundense]|uniref:MinD-like ATPase involved in chromosome partitioning or flagellar assembly n=1 Tax=Cryobacterium roopkundense TaxID=1001240 RepID=A0A099JIP8_9MICO|nr:hypothetical protein [Cryobacterium roopkundense]KGJ77497.1 hypothetical protein GY21_07650 [Cryobacterium roopkundense]MBB5642552.1 MinD-like ATPase involved in chromosome partitioning or flagellar assembly [Cryobacterium roopkundense]